MTASLSEILREETLRKAKCSDRVSRCRPLVLSLWAEINTSLQDGWSLRSV